ncbi:hypothetical protein Pmani_006436 [Petrolisthes manimaculis]|uniref:Uncharacterized protein n=1 Tax=Petrolisthes manimaculis TaxID=1843537 RepID=A0AAE1QAA7_9EUCA|nr:hypothetical protein Pmani_006436 [Petrolisthes manimaculis]
MPLPTWPVRISVLIFLSSPHRLFSTLASLFLLLLLDKRIQASVSDLHTSLRSDNLDFSPPHPIQPTDRDPTNQPTRLHSRS